MKTLFISAIIGLLSYTTYGQIPFPPMNVDNTTFNCAADCGLPYLNASQIIAPSTPSSPDDFSNGSNVIFYAGKSILLQPGFSAGNYINNGNDGVFLGQVYNIDNDNYNMAIMYPGTTVNTYQRFEIGIQIPVDVQTQIDKFLNNPKTPNNPSVDGINPYNPDQVMFKAYFYPPYGSPFIRYGFYYQDVTATLPSDTNNNGGAYSVSDNAYPFRVRFAPPTPGTWKVTIYLVLNGDYIDAPSLYGTFNVIENNNPGDIKSNGAGRLTFEHPNNYGHQVFFPIGQDIALADDGSVNCYLCGTNHASYNLRNSYITDLAANKGNFVRIVMTPFSNDIESANSEYSQFPAGVQPTPLVYNQPNAWELDKTIEQCENEGVYVLLNIQANTNLDLYPAWASHLWNQTSPVYAQNPYYNYFRHKYLSGPSDQDLLYDYFTDPDAITFFKDRLYYIEARWGYSPNLAISELIGESDVIGRYANASYVYDTYPGFQTAFTTWVQTMTNYLHSFYPSHLVTTGYATGPQNDINGQGNDYSYKYIDAYDNHQYDDDQSPYFVRPENSSRWEGLVNSYGASGTYGIERKPHLNVSIRPSTYCKYIKKL